MKTHWKKLFNPNYLGAYSFDENETKELKIKLVKVEQVIGKDGKKEDCTVIYFAGNEKPLICNKTNAKAIAELTGSNYIEDWIGVTIALVVKEVRAFGDVVDAVRVSLKRPAQRKPEREVMDEFHLNFEKALAAVKAGQYKAADVAKKYHLTKSANELLKAAQNEAL